MAPALILNLPQVALWVIAILANFTALQRTVYVRRQAYDRLKAAASKGGSQ